MTAVEGDERVSAGCLMGGCMVHEVIVRRLSTVVVTTEATGKSPQNT